MKRQRVAALFEEEDDDDDEQYITDVVLVYEVRENSQC